MSPETEEFCEIVDNDAHEHNRVLRIISNAYEIDDAADDLERWYTLAFKNQVGCLPTEIPFPSMYNFNAINWKHVADFFWSDSSHGEDDDFEDDDEETDEE